MHRRNACVSLLTLFNLRHARDLKSTTSRRKTLYVIILYVRQSFFLDTCTLFSGGRGSFLALLTAGRAGGPSAHHGASSAPAGLRGACSGRSNSPNMASSHGVAFRGARAEQDNGKPTHWLFCYCRKISLFCGGHCTISSRTSSWREPLLCVCGHSVCVYRVCYDKCACVCSRCVRVCVCVCWNPTFQLWCVSFALLAAAAAAV